jgi:hypothetical protein
VAGRVKSLTLLVCVALVIAACSGGKSTPTSGRQGKAGAGADPAAVARYGYAPTNDAHLQPDVVVIGGGASAIRSASGDGLTWTIDGKADGAADLRIGSVMFATSEAVGRVAALSDAGGNRVVTLAPVQLTDVLRDGTINLDQNLDLGSAVFQPVPDLPGTQSEPTATDTGGVTVSSARRFELPPVQLVARRAATLPAPLKQSVSVPVGPWTIKPYAEAGKLGVNITRDTGGLKLGVDFSFPVENFHISSAVAVQNGQVTKSGFVVEGVKGMDITLQAGVANGSLDNSKIAVELPIEVNAPIPPSPATAGIPLNIKLTYKLVIETALTGNNSTLFASGKYKLAGPFGISGGKIQEPAFSVDKSIIDSLGGITLGPSGLVIAVKMKLLAGIGTPAATVGPFGSFTAAVGVTNGSSLGAALARCHGASLDLKVGAGVGLSISPAVFEALKGLFPKKTKIENSIDVSKTILHRSQIVPDVPLCNQAAGG